MMKRFFLLLISVVCVASCVKSPEQFFVKLASIDYAKYQNYSVGDMGQSAYYCVCYRDTNYFIVMPVSSDAIRKIDRYKPRLSECEKDSLINNNIPIYDNIPLDSEVVEPIEDICLMYRKTWQMAPQSCHLADLWVDDEGNTLLHICWKFMKRGETWYNVYIPFMDGLQDLRNFNVGHYNAESIYEKEYVKISDCLYYRKMNDEAQE